MPEWFVGLCVNCNDRALEYVIRSQQEDRDSTSLGGDMETAARICRRKTLTCLGEEIRSGNGRTSIRVDDASAYRGPDPCGDRNTPRQKQSCDYATYRLFHCLAER